MDIAVALPMRIYSMEELAAFAKVAEECPFSCINVGERLCYNNHEPLTTLAALAGITRRVRLMTGVIVLPVHEPVDYAKRIASLDILTKKRLVLGVGVGPREPDFKATQSSWNGRGQYLEEQIAIMRRVWRGQPPYEGCDPVPPSLPESRPELIMGGFAEVALRRAGRLADGFHSFDFVPNVELHVQRNETVKASWNEAGRSGKPRLIASTFFSLGVDARKIYEAGMQEFYGYTPEMREWAMASEALTSPTAIKDAIKKFEDAGIDEMLFATAHHLGPESWLRLADAIA